jgi:Flp pilus assembly protein TadG
MASLTRLILVRLRRDDRGVVAVIVAIFLGAGVLLGMGALVIDVGQIYQERAELQNGADAAALGVAKSCALGACSPGVASQLADGNASALTGGTEGVPVVCGSGSLGACPPASGALTSCPAAPPAGTNYVDVYTATQLPSGSTLLPPAFAATLLGNSGDQGTTVGACAQAEWGAPAAATAVALTISACEWDQATQQGAVFPAAPPYSAHNPQPLPSVDQVLTWNPGNDAGCPTEATGADGPGTFGWAQPAGGNCTLQVSGPFAESGGGMPGGCIAALQNAQQNQIPILVPVYVSLTNGTFSLQGFADFVVTGYDVPGSSEPDWLNAANDCAAVNCVTGYFVQGVIPSTGSFAGPSLGASVIDLTG